MEEILTYVDEEHVLMASDFPHPDGFADARDYQTVLTKVSEDTAEKIRYGNLRKLLKV
jgi:predicted TIM-barrel fold metal-dependent hydrolase